MHSLQNSHREAPEGLVEKSVENFGRKCKKVENYSYFCID